jgi:RNA polymerase sigma-70 factor (ECF subfamily)
MGDYSSIQTQGLINRMNAGDGKARDELIAHTADRLHKLTRKMFEDFGRVKRWADTDDVMQNSMLRLLRALEAVRPASAAEYYRLAACQIRRELVDMARHYFGPEGLGANHRSIAGADGQAMAIDPVNDAANSTLDPSVLSQWTEIHDLVEKLPDEQREVFDLLWYHEMTQEEAASILNVSVPTIKRRWLAARLRLQESLKKGAGLGKASLGQRA